MNELLRGPEALLVVLTTVVARRGVVGATPDDVDVDVVVAVDSGSMSIDPSTCDICCTSDASSCNAIIDCGNDNDAFAC